MEEPGLPFDENLRFPNADGSPTQDDTPSIPPRAPAVEALQDLVGGGVPAPPLPEPPSVAAALSAAPTYLMQISRRAMATDFEVFSMPLSTAGRRNPRCRHWIWSRSWKAK